MGESARIRFLFAMFQGGGNIPLIMPIVTELVKRGHEVRIIAGPGIRGRKQPVSQDFRGRIEASGAQRVEFVEPPVDPFESSPPVRGVAFGWMPKRYERVSMREARTTLWSAPWASNVIDEIGRAPADLLVCDYWLFGAIAAGEASRVPTAVIVHNAFPPRPARLPPPRSVLDALSQVPQRWALQRIWARDGLPIHNQARRELGLPDIASSPFGECDRAGAVLVLGYEAFDFPTKKLRTNVKYVGTPIDDADATADAWSSPWPADDSRPMVLVSLSTLPQGQGPAMRNILEAVGAMPVRALVTLGPSLNREDFAAPANVVFEKFVPHSAVLPLASAIVSQCGLSTLTKALRLGVPLVCIPLIADQPDNAARIAAKGAGVWLSPGASPQQIRQALSQVLFEPSFREAARRLGASMAGDKAEERAADELEAVAQQAQRLQGVD
jgi:UDP:flavonoid glycosyltransferase YjiC (YdhE family)